MKQFISILILLLGIGNAFAQSSREVRTIENPDFIPLFSENVDIRRVEFGKKETTLHFRLNYPEGSKFSFMPTTYLVDEDGKRYQARSSEGFELGKSAEVGKEGFKDVSISFDALPEGTRVFDCIEGPCLDMTFQFYGIREKGQDWNVFPKKEVADNPIGEQHFRIDTVYVSGRITKSKYDRWTRAVHEMNGYSQTSLLQPYRENHGCFDRFYVAKDGTFSFKVIVAKPCLDKLWLSKQRIPILLIPGDSLYVEISHLNEYNQQMTFKSRKGDYSRMLNNFPFMWQRELANPTGTLSFSETGKMAAETWQPLHEEKERNLEVNSYLSAKYHFTPTEKKIADEHIRATSALTSVLRMTAPLVTNYHKRYDSLRKEGGGVPSSALSRKRSFQEILEDSIHLDFSFLKECSFDDPAISVSTWYEALAARLVNLSGYILFHPEAKGLEPEADSLNLCAAAEMLGAGETLLAWLLSNRTTYNNASGERVRPFDMQFKLPHTRILNQVWTAETESSIKSPNYSYPVASTLAAPIVKKLTAPYKDKKVILMSINYPVKKNFIEIDSLYRANRTEMDKEAVILPYTTSKLVSKKQLKEMQKEYPVLKNAVMLKGEDYLKILGSFSFQLDRDIYVDKLILPDGTYETSATSFFDKYKKKKR